MYLLLLTYLRRPLSFHSSLGKRQQKLSAVQIDALTQKAFSAAISCSCLFSLPAQPPKSLLQKEKAAEVDLCVARAVPLPSPQRRGLTRDTPYAHFFLNYSLLRASTIQRNVSGNAPWLQLAQVSTLC